MKHQIAFVGGQLLPLVVGIKEFNPDKIYFIVSEESKGSVNVLKSFLSGKVFSESICNPFDFDSIKNTCEKLLNRIAPEDEVQFNVTGGTKIMVLAAQALIVERHLLGFYVNQNDTLLHLPSYQIQKLNSGISVKEFLEISGHKLSNSKTINDFTVDDFESVKEIEGFAMANDKLFYQVNSKVRSTFERLNKIPSTGQIDVNKSTKLLWSSKGIIIELNGNEIFRIQSPNSRSLFFNASWWELIVAKEISRWSKAKELLIQCELPFKTETQTMKNEIDVLINLGGKLIFVECKSGNVRQEDINKMKIVKDTYGGVISKSLLVSKFNPSQPILEKCKELNIDVFYTHNGNRQINPLSKILGTLDGLERKLTI